MICPPSRAPFPEASRPHWARRRTATPSWRLGRRPGCASALGRETRWWYYSFLYLLYIIYIYIYIYIYISIYIYTTIYICVCGHCPHEGIPSLYICISIYLSIYLSIVWCTMYMYHIRRTSFMYLYAYLWVYIFWIWVPSQGGLWVWFGWLAVPSWIHWDRIIDLRFIYTIWCIGAYINEFTYTIGLMWDLRPPVFAVNTLGGGRGDWKF